MAIWSTWLNRVLDAIGSALLPRLERAFIELEEKEEECVILRKQIAGLQRRLNEANYLVDAAQEERDELKHTCWLCNGSGRDPHFQFNACPECKGSGESR